MASDCPTQAERTNKTKSVCRRTKAHATGEQRAAQPETDARCNIEALHDLGQLFLELGPDERLLQKGFGSFFENLLGHTPGAVS